MSELVVMPKEDWQNILAATKSKSGTSDALKSGEVAPKITNIKTEPVLQDKTVTENGTYTADSGYDGLGSVTVEVKTSSSQSSYSQGYICDISFSMPTITMTGSCSVS